MDITKIRPRHNDTGGRSGWSDFDNQRNYFRIYAGVAWPHKGAPGFVVLVGEEARELASERQAEFFALSEWETRTAGDMLSKCAEVFVVTDAFYSNIVDQAEYALLHEFNLRQRQRHSPSLQLLNAPLLAEGGDPTQLFRYAESLLDEKTQGGRKTVSLGGCVKVQGALQRIPAGWDAADDILSLPGAAALYYALGAMFRLPYSMPSRNSGRALTEYDVLSDRSPSEQYDHRGRFRGPMQAQIDPDPYSIRMTFPGNVTEPDETGPTQLDTDYDIFSTRWDYDIFSTR
jgi:hypothetical protein